MVKLAGQLIIKLAYTQGLCTVRGITVPAATTKITLLNRPCLIVVRGKQRKNRLKQHLDDCHVTVSNLCTLAHVHRQLLQIDGNMTSLLAYRYVGISFAALCCRRRSRLLSHFEKTRYVRTLAQTNKDIAKRMSTSICGGIFALPTRTILAVRCRGRNQPCAEK